MHDFHFLSLSKNFKGETVQQWRLMKCTERGRGGNGRGTGGERKPEKNTMEGRSLRSMREVFKDHQPLLQCE